MKRKYSDAVGRTIKLEHDVDKIIRIAELSISELIEAGLISLVKQPGERRDKLLQESIRIVEDRIMYYTECLKELMDLKENGASITQTDPPITKTTSGKDIDTGARLLVRDIRNSHEFLATQSEYEQNKDVFKIITEEA